MADNLKVYLVHYESRGGEADIAGFDTFVEALLPARLGNHALLVHGTFSAKQLHQQLARYLGPEARLSVFTVHGPFELQDGHAFQEELGHRIKWGWSTGDSRY